MEKGRSDLGMLQRPLWRLPSPYETGSVVFYAFDLLYLDGRDLRRLPQRERRLLLHRSSLAVKGRIRLSEEVQADGEEFLRAACPHGLARNTVSGPSALVETTGGGRSLAPAATAL